MIEIKGLTKKFDIRGIAGVHDLSLSLRSGEIFALMGPNGCGKTTLLKLISNQISADTGNIKTSGTTSVFEAEEPKDEPVQKFLENKVFIKSTPEQKIELARDMASLFEFTSQLHLPLTKLSAGQLQKVILASHLINRPALLLLDEPFTNLDPFTRKEILNSLFKVIREQETTLLWVTHDLNDALMLSDRIGIMNFGKLAQVSSPMELMKSPRDLFVAQFLGFQNFFPVTKTDDGFETPWGLFKSSFKGEKSLLVVPNTGWEIDPKSTFEVKIKELYPKNQMLEIKGSWEGKNLFIQLPLTSLIDRASQSLKIRPKENECFFIMA